MEIERSSKKKLIIISACALGCALLLYVSYTLLSNHKPDSKSLLNKDQQNLEIIRQQQESISRTIAQQQSISNQARETANRTVNDVQRTLKSIDDINRINQINLQNQRNAKP